MYLTHLKLCNFRNFLKLEVSFSPQIIFIWGGNAQGKSNFLEAISLLTFGRSPYGNKDIELINWEENFTRIEASIHKRTGKLRIELFVEKTGSLPNTRKWIYVNSNPVRRIGDLLQQTAVVLFTTEDINIIKGEPTSRRRFLDQLLSQINISYFFSLQRYHRIKEQRNYMLRKIALTSARDEVLLDTLNQQLVRQGVEITIKRYQLIKRLELIANKHHRQITGKKENLNIEYHSNISKIEKEEDLNSIEERFIEHLNRKKKEELTKGITLIGPHRDELVFKLDNIDMKTFGSQGQQRTIVLALKLTELEILTQKIGESPIFLLDDVFSELDEQRSWALMEALQAIPQAFITSTRPEINQGKFTFPIISFQLEKERGLDKCSVVSTTS